MKNLIDDILKNFNQLENNKITFVSNELFTKLFVYLQKEILKYDELNKLY